MEQFRLCGLFHLSSNFQLQRWDFFLGITSFLYKKTQDYASAPILACLIYLFNSFRFNAVDAARERVEHKMRREFLSEQFAAQWLYGAKLRGVQFKCT